ncbi:MAG: DUF2336 domain-containing protein [Alphaproteobacteria bacterium]|nr:DUF2336 domain-containing protein [Alphaproteobacteria bacterium]
MTLDGAAQAMSDNKVSADDLFELARDKTEDGRRQLLETVSDLFLGDGESLSDRERVLMGEILRQLIHEMEVTVRRDLAEKLADNPNVPSALIVDLANDEAMVAHEILMRSDVLQDVDLIEIIQHRTLQHQLAVTMRKEISDIVTRALVDAGDEDVITSLLNNHGAKFSREVMEYLVSESKRVDTYQNPLVHRPDLPPDLAQRMYWWVSAALRKHIFENFSMDRDALDDAMNDAGLANDTASTGGPGNSDEPSKLVDRIAEVGELDEHFLVTALRQGEVALFEAAMCKMTELRPTVFRRILFESGGEALALLCRAIDLDIETFLTVYELSRKAKDGQNGNLSEERVKLRNLYESANREDAEKVLKRWRRSAEYLHALNKVDGDG